MSNGSENPPLEMRGITKYFLGVRALDNIDFHVERGEVLGLVGSNGAGKSTLMKVLSGVYGDYEGQILLDGVPARLGNPLQALNHGIAVIYQEFSLVGTLSIAENIFLGKEPRREVGGIPFLNRHKLKEKAVELLEELNFGLNPGDLVRNLGVAEQQLVQIAKTMTEKPKILVMDEPTARLSRRERDNLFRIIARFREQGTAIIYISHFLEEVFMVASRVTVLRDGSVVANSPIGVLDHQKLVFLMLGRSVETGKSEREKSEKSTAQETPALLSVENFSMGDKFRDVSFELREGEILGITGLVGAGRTELARAVFGAEKRAAITGNVRLKGQKFNPRTPRNAVEMGVALAPEDRKQQGLVLCRPIADNITMAVNNRITRGFFDWFLDHKKRRSLVDDMIRRLDIRMADARLRISTLSGGNQQKVVLAKWLATQARVLILDQPTAGIDVGTKDEIYRLLDELAAQGVGIVVISDDPEELSRTCGRVLVMRRGKIAGELRGTISSDSVLEAVTAETAITEAAS